ELRGDGEHVAVLEPEARGVEAREEDRDEVVARARDGQAGQRRQHEPGGARGVHGGLLHGIPRIRTPAPLTLYLRLMWRSTGVSASIAIAFSSGPASTPRMPRAAMSSITEAFAAASSPQTSTSPSSACSRSARCAELTWC